MADLIDRQELYEQTAEWEASALHMVEKLMHSEDPDDIKEWRKWSVVLQERTAFKHDVADAPAVDAVPVVRCADCALWNDGKCDIWSACGVTVLTAETGYCNFGEKRDDGDE